MSKVRIRGTRHHALCILALVLLLAVAAVWHQHRPLWDFFTDRERLREWVAGFGPLGPLVSIALNVGQVLLAPVPGQFINLVNGYLYGMWMGSLYSLAGLVLGSALAMWLSRRLGRPLVERLVDASTLARWDRLAAGRGPVFFFLIFLFPLVPDDVACFVIGLSALPIPQMLLLATLGRLPGLIFSCWLGAYATLLPWWAWASLTVGVALLAGVYLRYQGRLEDALLCLLRHLESLLTRNPGNCLPCRLKSLALGLRPAVGLRRPLFPRRRRLTLDAPGGQESRFPIAHGGGQPGR